jgi:hypothetical protein
VVQSDWRCKTLDPPNEVTFIRFDMLHAKLYPDIRNWLIALGRNPDQTGTCTRINGSSQPGYNWEGGMANHM